jgi:hypothetical protein
MSFPIITITPPGIEAYDLTEHRAMIRRSKATRGLRSPPDNPRRRHSHDCRAARSAHSATGTLLTPCVPK